MSDKKDSLKKFQQSVADSADLRRKYTAPSSALTEALKSSGLAGADNAAAQALKAMHGQRSALAEAFKSSRLAGADNAAAEALKAMHGQRSALAEAFKSSGLLSPDSAATQSLKAMHEQSATFVRSMQGPLADLQSRFRSWAGDPETQRQLEVWSKLRTEYETRFRLPEYQDALRQYAELVASTNDVSRLFAQRAIEIRNAFAKMQKPWLDSIGGMRSVRGFAELQGIGAALNMLPPFAEQLAASLRSSLGDWRDKITYPPAIFDSLSERAEFYVSRGFDPALTDLPVDSFAASADIAGLRHEPPPLIVIYEPPVSDSGDPLEESEFVRTNQAHDWLQRLESHLRQFIDELMTRAFSADWAKHRLPNGMYDEWCEKQAKATAQGRDKGRRLIAYADFTDYEKVICRSDNWKAVFARFFVRPELARETFQRLYPIRVDTMHSRPISQDDQLFLWVEVRRIILVIAKVKA